MDIILGSSALSNFRLEKIKSALQNENISIDIELNEENGNGTRRLRRKKM